MPALFPAPRRRRTVVAAWLVVLAGCDIRDEAPRPPRPQSLLGSGIAPGARGAPAIEYVGGYDAGRQRALAEDRPLLLVCTAAWCRFSIDMTQRTLRDPGLVAVSRRAVCVQLDADRDATTCRALGVKGFPTLLVLASDGEERLRSTGRSSPEVLAAALERAFEPQRLATAPADPPRIR